MRKKDKIAIWALRLVVGAIVIDSAVSYGIDKDWLMVAVSVLAGGIVLVLIQFLNNAIEIYS